MGLQNHTNLIYRAVTVHYTKENGRVHTEGSEDVRKSDQEKADFGTKGEQSMGASADEPSHHDQLSYLWSAHSALGELIRNCDFKASLVVGWTTAIIGGLFVLDFHHIAIGSSKQLLASGRVLWLLRVSAALSLLLNAGAFLMAVWTIVPRYDGRKWATSRPGCLDWKSILSFGGADRFIEYSLQLKPEESAKDLAAHIYTIATIADAKFTFVKYATYTSSMGGIFSAIVVFFI